MQKKMLATRYVRKNNKKEMSTLSCSRHFILLFSADISETTGPDRLGVTYPVLSVYCQWRIQDCVNGGAHFFKSKVENDACESIFRPNYMVVIFCLFPGQ